MKRLKQAAEERVRNNALKTVLRKSIKETREKIAQGQVVDISQVYSRIDSVRGKGTIHKKRASRLKSRLAKAAARATAKDR
jgi:ribosomal protein S20